MNIKYVFLGIIILIAGGLMYTNYLCNYIDQICPYRFERYSMWINILGVFILIIGLLKKKSETGHGMRYH